MSFSREVKDFTEGFTQGYKIWSDADTQREQKEYHQKLYAKWEADSATAAANAKGKKGDIPAGITSAADTAAAGVDPNKDLGGGGGGNKPQLTPDILNDPDKMRSFIHQAESKGNYNATVYMTNGKPGPTANLTDMTLEQVQQYQDKMIAAGHASTAVGAGQYIASTLDGLIDKLGLDPKTTKFTPDVQDKLTDELLRQRGYDSFKAGKMDAGRFLTNLSYEWASLPDPHTGRSHYAGTAGNASTVGYGSGIFATAPTPLPGAQAQAARPLAQPATTMEAGAPAPAPAAQKQQAAQPSGTSAQPPVVQPAPAIAPSMATPATGQTASPAAQPTQIPVPPSMQPDAPGAAAIPPQVSPVQLASAVSPWAIPGHPNPLAMAGGGLVTPQPQGSRYDSGSQVAESVTPPHGMTAYANGGNVMPPQLQGDVRSSLPGYAMGGEIEPEAENTEGDTSPIPGFDPNTPVDVRGYDGLFTAAQAQAAKETDDTTPGIDEYWAAARRQHASLPQQPQQTPQQDPQILASRPPGQAIPTTGSTAPGDTGQPTSFFDFIGKAIGGIADAVHAGLMGLGKMLGLTSGIPSGAPADPAAVQKLASGEGIKYSPDEIKAVDKAVGIPDTLTPALKNVARLSAGYEYYRSRGDMASANKWAGSMLATIADSVRMKGTQALLAGKHGDFAMMANKLKEGHDEFPDGNVMKVSDVSKDGASYEIIGPDGRVSEAGRATIDDMMKLATNMSNGTEFFKQAGYLGGKSTPQQIAKDKSDAALAEYSQAPGPMNAQDQAWRASKSPEQLAAIDKMDWKDREALKTKELQGQKQSTDEQNEQEATRLLGLEREAQQEYAAARAQRTNEFEPSDLEAAALTKLQGVQKAINAWAQGGVGRYKYVQGLEGGVTSRGNSAGAAGAIPGPGGGGAKATKAQEDYEDRRQQYFKDKQERAGVQSRVDAEGRPIEGTRGAPDAYQRTLELQNVQKTYEEEGPTKGSKKADLEKISGELDDQSPHLKDPENAGLRQRFGEAAATVMNSNEVTAKDAVGIVKAATELDKDGKPKTQIAYTRDGRVRVGDYAPMIMDRKTLTQLGNLAQAHAKAQPIKPELQIAPRDPAQDEQDLQASQTGLGLRPRSPADAGPPADRAAATVPGTPGPAHGLWGELPPSPASPMSPDERDEASRSGRGFRPLGMVQDLVRGRIPSAPPMQPPPTESPPGGFRPLGMVQDMLSSPRRAISPDERDEANARAVPSAGARAGSMQDYVAQRKRAIDVSRGAASSASADKLRAAVEDFIQNPQSYRQAPTRVQTLLDQMEKERKGAQYWTPVKEKQNQGYVADIATEARRQSEKSGVGMAARREDEQEVSRLATKGTMREEAKRRANQTIEGLRARRTAIPAAGS